MKALSRRRLLALAASPIVSRLFGATLPTVHTLKQFDVDRLLAPVALGGADAESKASLTRYTAGATVTLFSIPIVTKGSVGSGYAVIERAQTHSGSTLAIQFGAGSAPEHARGLNRLGYIEEAIIEESGNPVECAWIAFMTTSQEKNLDQAKQALHDSGPSVPYTASQGCGVNGDFRFHVQRLEFPSRFTWRDAGRLIGAAKDSMASEAADMTHAASTPATGEPQPATFLYCVHRAMLDSRPHTSSSLVFNGKAFQLDTQKETDEASTAYFAGKNLLQSGGSVVRLNATITEKRTREKTPFRVWYESGQGHLPPLRFEYQAKSFLRLTFEADARAETPAIHFAFKKSGEDA
jgi:hypothetical protein